MSFAPFGRQLSLVAQPSPALAQAQPTVSQTRSAEPSLERALGPLSPAEAASYATWDPKTKWLFLAGYQWVAVGTARGLSRPDGTPFDGFLPQGINVALAALQAMASYLKDSPELAAGADQATTVLQEATNKTEPQGQNIAKKYRALRDRIAWELAMQGATVEYEIVGDDPANPGVIFTRKIGEDKSPDLSAVFSTNTPRDFWKNGLILEQKYEDAGVPFKKLDLSGANPRLGIGAPPVLAIIITAVVAVLAFFWLYNHVMEQKKINQRAVDLIVSDPKLTDAEKADRLQKLKSANSFFDDIFGTQFPWMTLIVGATIVGVAYFVLPRLLQSYDEKPERAREPRRAHA